MKFRVVELPALESPAALCEWFVSQAGEDLLLFWELDKEIAPFLRLLPQATRRQLWGKEASRWGEYEFFYIPQKMFSVSARGNRAVFYHLEQYYPDYENPGVDVAQAYADQLQNALLSMKIRPHKLSSPIAIFEAHHMAHLDLPKNTDIPEEFMGAGKFAWMCCGRQWIEIYKIGYFSETYDYDLNSAYPTIMAGLLDTRYGTFTHSSKYQPGADYGWCECEVEIDPKALVHPIIHVSQEGELATPVGNWRGFITKAEIDFIRKWHLGDVDILDGYWWQRGRKAVYPLTQIVGRLIEYKKSADPTIRMLAKRMSVGMYGKFGEEWRDRFGTHFNPLWFSYISTLCRLRVAETIYRTKCWNDLIRIEVDGIRLTKPLPAIPEGWKLSGNKEPFLGVSSGLGFTKEKHPKGLFLQDVLEMIEERPTAMQYQKDLRRLVTLGEALEEKDLNLVGQEREYHTGIDLIGLNPERHFAKLPRTGRELLARIYESVPRVIDEAGEKYF